MKIAIFHHLIKGGAYRVLQEQIKGLKKKHSVDVYCLAPKLPSFRLKADFLKFFTLKKLHRQLAQKIDQQNYDIVLVHPCRETQAPYLLRFLKTPRVYYAHESLRLVYEKQFQFKEKVNWLKSFYEIITRWYLKKIDRENLKSATKILVNSRYIQKQILKNYSLDSSVCFPGVNANHFHPLKINKKREILFVGQPTKSTGFGFLKQAVRLIKAKPKIKIVDGQLAEKDLIKSYNEAMITVCLNHFEPFGLVPLESMACETAVIAVKEGGYQETVINGVTGFLITRKPKILAEKVDLLLSRPDLAVKIGRAGRRHVQQNWTWQKHLEQLEKILYETVNFHHHC